ncbi:DUF6340 family protein [Flavihumibacter petaseus]|uniref:Uncharacterized protein n=1 Tax=Flavihumibacter petaseus NBRC 106054 TaxID=1220578 RepID=A0A0E9N044_9BACT|nr:DUF6340 family protein [Flavihumibacter petaseus]GAO42991.1 hypothetical protein FPE01S_02_00960 [Flavihumibacter petaseus NBRC 106054]
MKNPVYLLSLTLFLGACSSTNLVHISVQEPAVVSIPRDVRAVSIVNRSMAAEENKVLDQIHRTINLESKSLIDEGGKACVNGLEEEMVANNRFERIVKLDSTNLRSFGAGVFPAALNWEQVEKICRETNTDALFSLELFDANTRVDYAALPGVIKTGISNIPAVTSSVTMNTTVRTGWRLYYPATKLVLDEAYTNKNLQFSGKGINPAVAADALFQKKEAVKQAGNEAGHIYATRIDPYWIRVTRDYYVRGNDQFGVAKRKAQTGNWDQAGKIWEEQTKSSSNKVAGRACYNMAIISEINGDLDGAISWAQKAYEDYRVKIALRYVNMLRNRKVRNEVLAAQQGVN